MHHVLRPVESGLKHVCNCVPNLVVGAGVSDIEQAQAGLDFAKRFEIIKGSETKNIRLREVDLSDASAIAAALPRYSA